MTARGQLHLLESVFPCEWFTGRRCEVGKVRNRGEIMTDVAEVWAESCEAAVSPWAKANTTVEGSVVLVLRPGYKPSLMERRGDRWIRTSDGQVPTDKKYMAMGGNP